jgi:SNF2 family DNA or RNA helicase
MNEMGISCVEYHGGISAAERERAVDDFQSGAARVFIGQPQSGGIGLTLTAAETVIYYSNDFNLETRLQSEDRAHRIGTKRHVVYIDLIAQDTIDETIARSLQAKTNVAANVLGDLRK